MTGYYHFRRVVREQAECSSARLLAGRALEIEELPEPSGFSKINCEIPELPDYTVEVFPDEYWNCWPQAVENTKLPWLNAEEVEKIYHETGCVGRDEFAQLVNDVREGVDIGCVGSARIPTHSPNNKSAYTYGERLMDSLASWCKSGIASGPFTKNQIEQIFPNGFTINAMQVAVKEDGKARPVIDMSAPRLKPGETVPEGVGTSVNSGIDVANFPSKMSSLEEISSILAEIGCPAQFCKIDWAEAYKHCEIRKEDRCLQVLSIGGRYFIEERITFGSSSSPGIFERPSWFLLRAAVCKAKARQELTTKQIDDAMVFSKKGDGVCQRVYENYRQLADRMGARLAPETKPDKAFSPRSKGVALGVELDLESWTWRLPRKKMVAIRHSLEVVRVSKSVDMGLVKTLVGRLNHYSSIVPAGKVERSFITHLQTVGESRGLQEVAVTEAARDAAAWWLAALPAATAYSRIRDLRPQSVVVNDYHLYMDAAGGSSDSKNGAGGLVWETGAWFCYQWPNWLNSNSTNSLGVNFAAKLSFLEAVAGLMCLLANPRLFKGKRIMIKTDNSGFVGAWRTKSGKDQYLHSIIHALAFVERGLEMELHVIKTRRCSEEGEVVADHLSKGKVFKAKKSGLLRKEFKPSKVLRDWMQDPIPGRRLGKSILGEIEDDCCSVLWWEPRHFQ